MAVLEVHEVSKTFGSFKAVDNVSFEVTAGHVYGVVGPNGAGKTTTIRMIMNILAPDSGLIKLFGQKMSDDLKTKIGYLPEERGLYQKMKVIDLIVFMAELRRIPVDKARKAAGQWLEKLNMLENSESKIEELSKGMQQKIQFISTIIHEPQLIILDEPFSGLDPVNVNLLKDIILELKTQGKAIMFSTHMMDTAEKLCDEVMMINKGKKVLDGKLQEIQKEYGKRSLHLEYDGDGAFIKNLDMVRNFDDYGKYIEVQLKDDFTVNDLLEEIIPKVQLTKMQSQRSSLNEIFISLAGGGKQS